MLAIVKHSSLAPFQLRGVGSTVLHMRAGGPAAGTKLGCRVSDHDTYWAHANYKIYIYIFIKAKINFASMQVFSTLKL